MALRFVRMAAGVLLGASGGLMYAASWQRWADVCRWGDAETGPCLSRQDHRYDFVAPSAPWEPVGDAAQLAGWSLLVFALAFVLLPWGLTGRRPGRFSTAASAAVVLALGAVGLATLRSGLAGSVVPVPHDLALYVWLLVPPVLLGRFAAAARGWPVAAALALIAATPVVAGFSYAIGPYDSQPWWEAITGVFTATAGLLLLCAAVLDGRSRTQEGPDPVTSSSRRPQVQRVGP